ncbi:IS200/IS605 family transposase [Streptomyces sp. NPDC004589]|uniref:IS200/IS605 family transposase n=1 Tax=Streptomyces sp. NPDC004589 TaxID=3154553 RepID=UPI0033BD9BBA
MGRMRNVYARIIPPTPFLVSFENHTSFETELKEFNGERDHVHLLVHYPPKIALSKLINSLKGVTSRYLRSECTSPHQPHRTGLGSCGGAPLSIIRQYIEGQKQPT